MSKKATVTKLPSGGKPSTKAAAYSPCYYTHPALEIAEGIKIYGGNCASPVVTDADIYIALDGSGSGYKKQYPWYSQTAFSFRIVDMSVPNDLKEFNNLLDWLKKELEEGKKVHIGCIGGHGRTGLVFAALRKHMTGDANATEYVRKHYCKKAVESKKQIDWLHKNFGIKKAKPTKGVHLGGSGSKQSSLFPDDWHKWSSSKGYGSTSSIDLGDDVQADAIPSAGSIWGKNQPKK